MQTSHRIYKSEIIVTKLQSEHYLLISPKRLKRPAYWLKVISDGKNFGGYMLASPLAIKDADIIQTKGSKQRSEANIKIK
jgi:hypothetical protein